MKMKEIETEVDTLAKNVIEGNNMEKVVKMVEKGTKKMDLNTENIKEIQTDPKT